MSTNESGRCYEDQFYSCACKCAVDTERTNEVRQKFLDVLPVVEGKRPKHFYHDSEFTETELVEHIRRRRDEFKAGGE